MDLPVVEFPPGVYLPIDFYALLEVNPNAPQSELRHAYLRKCALFHPDKQPSHLRDAASAAFARLSLAFSTLSDPTAKDAYDMRDTTGARGKGITNFARIETGDKVFNALQAARQYAEVLPLLREVPAIEAAHGISPGTLRVSVAGECTCTGVGCVLHLLEPFAKTDGDGILHRVLLCSKHSWIHRCGEKCTNNGATKHAADHRVCALWGAYLGARFRTEVANAWTLEVAPQDDPVRPSAPYWFNQRTGLTAWCAGAEEHDAAMKSRAVTPHACTRETCQAPGFVELDVDGVWACRASTTIHMCTPTQCRWHWRTPVGDDNIAGLVGKAQGKKPPGGNLCCWATMRAIAEHGEEDAGEMELTTADRPAINVLQASGVEQRRITFTDTRSGHTVTSVVERLRNVSDGTSPERPPGSPTFDTTTGVEADPRAQSQAHQTLDDTTSEGGGAEAGVTAFELELAHTVKSASQRDAESLRRQRRLQRQHTQSTKYGDNDDAGVRNAMRLVDEHDVGDDGMDSADDADADVGAPAPPHPHPRDDPAPHMPHPGAVGMVVKVEAPDVSTVAEHPDVASKRDTGGQTSAVQDPGTVAPRTATRRRKGIRMYHSEEGAWLKRTRAGSETATDIDTADERDLCGPELGGCRRNRGRASRRRVETPMERIRRGVRSTIRRLNNAANTDAPVARHAQGMIGDDDEGVVEEADTVHGVYGTDLIDHAGDMGDDAEDAGDYQTQYTLAGGVEAIMEEGEELEEHITEARSEYLEYATQQMLNANAPNQPIAWHGDPTVGVPLSAGDRHNLHVSTMGSGAHAGTLRLYQGRVIQVMQNPPIFRLPNKGAIKRLHSRGTGRKAVIRAESRLETLKRQQHIRNTADLHHSSVNDGRLTARTRKGRLRTAAHGVPPPISPEYSPERDQETGHSNMHTAERMCVDPTDTDSNNTDK
eukprot:m.29624 g.29624  ORF g.29624 m.29624 type:complete len:937 (-) comp13760_c0_seq1:95-2905(-)